jgi:hypothetical protein
MEAKKKAHELIEKYWHEISGVPNYVGVDLSSDDSYVKSAKLCALICVDELISSYAQYTGMYDQDFFDSEREYWQSIKAEINKL